MYQQNNTTVSPNTTTINEPYVLCKPMARTHHIEILNERQLHLLTNSPVAINVPLFIMNVPTYTCHLQRNGEKVELAGA